jgi:hypothetical protein
MKTDSIAVPLTALPTAWFESSTQTINTRKLSLLMNISFEL